MEVYLEILRHSGPGRLGKFHLGKEEIATPNFFHFPSYPGGHEVYLADSASRTRKKPVVYDYGFFKRGSKVRASGFGLLPEFPVGFDVPRGMAEEAVEETLRVAREYPGQGAVITATKFPELVEKATLELRERPLLAVGSGSRLAEQPRLLVEVVSRIRETASPNTAIYFPFASPTLFSVLAYMGVDFFDSATAILGAVRARMLTHEGFRSLAEMGELPCRCRVCDGRAPEDLVEAPGALLAHNLGYVKKLLCEVREALREGRLREYAEEKAVCDAKAMAVLRILSHEKGDYLEKYTPIASGAMQRYVSQESYTRPEVKRWHRRLMERYTPPRGKKLSVILPCSARKPYSKSKSHRVFRRYIRKGAGGKLGLVHEVILTSPLGLVPRELERVYPASSYDIPVTGHWSGEEKLAAVKLLRSYLGKATTKAIAQVDGAYREICAEAGVELGMEDVLSKASLEHFSRRIAELLGDERGVYDPVEDARKVCDYQFGLGAGEYLLPEGAELRGLCVFYDGEQVAAFNPGSGLLALTLRGAEMLQGYGKYLVRVSFRPRSNSLFCAGIEEAGEEIRPADEVIVVYKDEVVGVGRAVLSGVEMTEARKGLGVKLRHRR
jgi:archaeosine synthase